MFVLLFLLACSTDACRQLCATTAGALEGCLTEWGATWEDFDSTSRVEYGDRCRAQWDDERITLELRQLDVADGECTTAAEEIGSMDCDQLRVLYLP